MLKKILILCFSLLFFTQTVSAETVVAPTKQELMRYTVLKSQVKTNDKTICDKLRLVARLTGGQGAEEQMNKDLQQVRGWLDKVVDVDGILHFVQGGEDWLKGVNDGLINWLKGIDGNPHHGRDIEYEQRIIKDNIDGKFALYYLTDWQYVIYYPYSVQISNGVYRTSKIEYFFNPLTGNFNLREDTYQIIHFVNHLYDCKDYGAPSTYSVNDNTKAVLVYTNGDFFNGDTKVGNTYNSSAIFEGNAYYTVNNDIKTFDDIDNKNPQDVLKKDKDKPNPIPSIPPSTGGVPSSTSDNPFAFDANNLVQSIDNKSSHGLSHSLDKLNQLDTKKGIPPIIKFPLHELFGFCGTNNPFPNSDYDWIDFKILDDMRFKGISVIDYFRFLIGTGMVGWTLHYVLKVINSSWR